MSDDFYVDPTEPDPQFPGRPTHPDFTVLSHVLQGMDLRAGARASVLDISGVDQASLLYAIKQRLGTLNLVTHGLIETGPISQALYIDAFTLGKLYAEARR